MARRSTLATCWIHEICLSRHKTTGTTANLPAAPKTTGNSANLPAAPKTTGTLPISAAPRTIGTTPNLPGASTTKNAIYSRSTSNTQNHWYSSQ
ncbi:hypothetical protein RRG08_049959 [Elysia crispata]|uniref:Uncharacterized protein n=1 Tax=Elysia crispata TaxID=231223 RepID=A0AAE1D3X4_9GAST|nr:hypothetical protein RRG08_049959 [Elysia crispata]